MRLILKVFIFSFVIFFSMKLKAQDVRQKEVVVIKGEKFIVHQVQTGETIYSLTKNFGISREELEKYNPDITKGPRIGDMLKIPYRETAEVESPAGQGRGKPAGFLTHKVKSKNETAYFISKEYNISVEELYASNPGLKSIKKGTKLQIPYWKEQNAAETAPEISDVKPQTQPGQGNTLTHQVVSGETLYSLSKKYNVSEQEILNLNPDAGNLKAGTFLVIPVKSVSAVSPGGEGKQRASKNKYFEHIIESGETLWGITHKYDVSEETLKQMNPILNEAFPAGAVIRIPVKETEIELTKAEPVNEDAFIQHVVVKGETLFSISRMFDVGIYELKKYNPALENRNLVEGETILIPHFPDKDSLPDTDFIVPTQEPTADQQQSNYFEIKTAVQIPEACRPQQHKIQTYDVALFLPLFLQANDTLNRDLTVPDSMLYLNNTADQIAERIAGDTLAEPIQTSVFKKFYGNSENFIQFYEGVLLAIEHLEQQGIRVRLHVYDTERRLEAVKKFIYSDEFLKTDLIIGPIYAEVQRDVAQIAGKNRIPVISPLASQSDILDHNPYYYQVNPTREYLAEATASMVSEEYHKSNFIILKTQNYDGTPEGRMVNLFREKFFISGSMSLDDGVNFTIYDYQNEGVAGLRHIMSNTKENVIFIPSSDEGVLSITISNLNNLANDYPITLIGTNRYPGYQSIQLDHFHNLKLKYIAPFWIDYNSPVVNQFIGRFREEFANEPDNFGVQGYDVTTYFIQALDAFGHDFGDCLPYFHTDLVQGNYHFEKHSQFGGYMNQGVSVIGYTRKYDVIRERIKGQPKLVVAESE